MPKRDAEIENESCAGRLKNCDRPARPDLNPRTVCYEYERHRLTRAQADAQELKNARDSAEVVETAFYTFVLLSRSQVKLPVFSTGSPVGAAAFSGTGKPTC
ncbi:terminase small subunit [Escherichia coli]|uniref:terminase small subunit n=1 Tax=Escherichia coli TaxID=562 RepID=UPI00388E6448